MHHFDTCVSEFVALYWGYFFRVFRTALPDDFDRFVNNFLETIKGERDYYHVWEQLLFLFAYTMICVEIEVFAMRQEIVRNTILAMYKLIALMTGSSEHMLTCIHTSILLALLRSKWNCGSHMIDNMFTCMCKNPEKIPPVLSGVGYGYIVKPKLDMEFRHEMLMNGMGHLAI